MMDGGYYGVSDVIHLCYTAFFNYALLRNTVKLLRDFSVSPIHVQTPNKKVKKFIETWFEAIGLNSFMKQFFLEYYRSGNVFIYKFDGKISEDGLNMLKQTYAAAGEVLAVGGKTSSKVPIRYIILNPMQVYLQMGVNSPVGYVRMLSNYEIQRLRDPQTEEDKQVLQSFPKNVRDQIKQNGFSSYLYVPLDPNRLFPVFYDKMDYEPMAIPMAYPVLNDIEFKLELRRMDMALASTIERVILLVTTGRPADQFNQVPPKSNLENLQNIFRNQTIGRVLVADYTTKAEWVIPDLSALLGAGKYEQVDRDIKEGLASILSGDDKFANASIKVKIFIEGLKEGRRAFLENFLQPEVKKVCESMGFRNVPTLEFEEIRLEDEALMSRLYVEMAKLGLLTDEELNDALETGLLPTKDESLVHQELYKRERAKKLYQPMAPEKPEPAGSKGRPSGTGKSPAARSVTTPIGQKKVTGADEDGDVLRNGKYRFGLSKIADNIVSMNSLRGAVEAALVKKWKLKGELGTEEKGVAASIAQSIAFNEEQAKWNKVIASYIKVPKELPEAVAAELIDIRTVFGSEESPVDSWLAGVLAKSKVDTPNA